MPSIGDINFIVVEPPAAQEERNMVIRFNQIKVGVFILPLVILLEISLSHSMVSLGPTWPLHLSYFCNMCGLTNPTTFAEVITAEPVRAEYLRYCIQDNIMQVFEATYNSFISAYTNSLLGHILLVFGMLMERDPDNNVFGANGPVFKSENMWHLLGYFFLIVNVIAEVIQLSQINLPNPDEIFQGSTYEGCDASEVVEIGEVSFTVSQMAIPYSILVGISFPIE